MNSRLRSEHGQSLVIVTLLLLALVGMLALAFDGGNGFFQRRIAQNASDAGALAGARELCVSGLPDEAVASALNYAVDRNGALEANATVEYNLITVNSFITFPTTFGNALGRSELVASATAVAGCFLPRSATGPLPVAWSCRPPEGGVITDTCAIQYGEDHRYYVMDSRNVGDDVLCADPPNSGLPSGALDCDYDDDGVDDAYAGGDRSWLDLNGGGGGASELRNWVLGEDDEEVTVYTHWWLEGQPGNDNAVYFAAEERRRNDPRVIVPIFDKYCEGEPETFCGVAPDIYDDEDVTIYGSGISSLYYHIIGFAIFNITCVHSGPFKCDPPNGISGGEARSLKWIEGWFEKGTIGGLGGGGGGGGMDAGSYVLYLVQ